MILNLYLGNVGKLYALNKIFKNICQKTKMKAKNMSILKEE